MNFSFWNARTFRFADYTCIHGACEVVSTGVHSFIIQTVYVVEFVPPCTAKLEGKVKVLIGTAEWQVGFHLGNTGTGIYLVAGVDASIAVYILEADITGFGTRLETFACTVYVSSSFCISLEYAVSLIQPEAGYRITFNYAKAQCSGWCKNLPVKVKNTDILLFLTMTLKATSSSFSVRPQPN